MQTHLGGILSNQNSRPHAQTWVMKWKPSHALRSSVNNWGCNMNILIFSRPSRNTCRRHKSTRGCTIGDPFSIRFKCLETNVTWRLSESEGKNEFKSSSIYEQYISESFITDGNFGMLRTILRDEIGPSFLRHL